MTTENFYLPPNDPDMDRDYIKGSGVRHEEGYDEGKKIL